MLTSGGLRKVQAGQLQSMAEVPGISPCYSSGTS